MQDKAEEAAVIRALNEEKAAETAKEEAAARKAAAEAAAAGDRAEEEKDEQAAANATQVHPASRECFASVSAADATPRRPEELAVDTGNIVPSVHPADPAKAKEAEQGAEGLEHT